jgi:hypothetical protein
MKRATLSLLLTMFSLCASAQVYRWVDEKGKVHFGDRPIAKEMTLVPVLREARPQESVPAPGMKAEELRRAYGNPDRIESKRTLAGETLVWTYRKSKQVGKDFIVKIQDGAVTEVSTDSWLGGGPSVAIPRLPAGEVRYDARGAGDTPVSAVYQEQQVRSESAEKKGRCNDIKTHLQRVENEERRGGSASRMDSLREQKRRYSDQMWSQGCSFL